MAQLAAVGANTALNYCAETSFGVIPATPTMKIVRAKIGSKFDLKRDTFTSKEMSATRQVMGMGYGNRSGSGDLPFEFSYGSFDDFMEAVFGGTWTANVLKIGNVKRSFCFEQQWPDINVNDINTGVTMTGFSLTAKTGGIVEGSFTHQFKDQITTQTAYNATATGNMTFTATTIVRASGSFLTDGFSATGGDSVTTLGATTAANNKTAVSVSCTATVMTFGAATYTVDATNNTGLSVAKTLGTATAINTNSVFDSFTGVAQLDGANVASISGFDFKLDQTANASNVLFDPTVQQISLGTVNVTGTLTLRFTDIAYKRKFLAGTPFDVAVTLGATSKMYKIDLSSCYATAVTVDSGENELTQSIPFTSVYNSGDASSAMMTRTP